MLGVPRFTKKGCEVATTTVGRAFDSIVGRRLGVGHQVNSRTQPLPLEKAPTIGELTNERFLSRTACRFQTLLNQIAKCEGSRPMLNLVSIDAVVVAHDKIIDPAGLDVLDHDPTKAPIFE